MSEVSTIGLDIAKRVFQAHEADAAAAEIVGASPRPCQISLDGQASAMQRLLFASYTAEPVS